jgi:hypothetical protein
MVAHLFTKNQNIQSARTAIQEKIRCAYATVNTDPYAAAALQRLLNHTLERTDWPGVERGVPSQSDNAPEDSDPSAPQSTRFGLSSRTSSALYRAT